MKSLKIARNSPTNASKGYSEPPSRFRWSRTTFIFDGFWADLNRALSALFFQNRTSKIRKSPLPRGSPWGSKGGFWAPLGANPAFGPAERKGGVLRVGGGAPDCWERGPGCWGLAPKFWKNCYVIFVWLRNLGVWHELLGVWHAMLGVWHAKLGVWHTKLGVWLRCWGNPHLV